MQNAAARIALQRMTLDANMSAPDREILTAVLSQGQGDAPQSSSIVGILKQTKDTMKATLADVTATEEEAITTLHALMAARKEQKWKQIQLQLGAHKLKDEAHGDVVTMINTLLT